MKVLPGDKKVLMPCSHPGGILSTWGVIHKRVYFKMMDA